MIKPATTTPLTNTNADLSRPVYHFTPPANWMNDPNGVIQWQGRYHFFYQHNPDAPVWGNMHWGHAVSPDLVHWEHLPIALAPTPGGPDERGCFSGCMVVNNGQPTLIYTGVRGERYEIQSQCLAVSHDDLLTWEKDARNPVLSEVPAISGQSVDFRDPFVWREGDLWYMALGSQIKDQGGAIFLYRSSDLVNWEYLHPLLLGEVSRNGVFWECPNFFPLDDGRWVLIVSSNFGLHFNWNVRVLYFVGTYANQHFTPEVEGVLDYGMIYAPLSTLDDAGRRLLFGWVRELRSDDAMRAAGWSGAQSIPRVLSLDARGRLLMNPATELLAQRGEHFQQAPAALNGDQIVNIRGLALDIEAACTLQPDGFCTFTVGAAADGRERTDIRYDAARHLLTVESFQDGAVVSHLEGSHPLDDGEALTLRILLDGSVLEVLANQRTSLTHRLYPAHRDSQGVRLSGAQAHLDRLDIWKMASIWP